ncbi:hypothetical protein QJQ45_002113 [Haematococcus lacustris]|nr:hypothetical protein QJQ45_002113 [Haematococcus lacustris]
MVHLVPCKESMDAPEFAQLFIDKEEWLLGPWAHLQLDPQVWGMGTTTLLDLSVKYARVRLHQLHRVTGEPEEAAVADGALGELELKWEASVQQVADQGAAGEREQQGEDVEERLPEEVWKELLDPTLRREHVIVARRVRHASIMVGALWGHILKGTAAPGSSVCRFYQPGHLETLTHAFLTCPAVVLAWEWVLDVYGRLTGTRPPSGDAMLLLSGRPTRGEAPRFQHPDCLLWLRLRVACLGAMWRLRSFGAAKALQPQQVARRSWRRSSPPSPRPSSVTGIGEAAVGGAAAAMMAASLPWRPQGHNLQGRVQVAQQCAASKSIYQMAFVQPSAPLAQAMALAVNRFVAASDLPQERSPNSSRLYPSKAICVMPRGEGGVGLPDLGVTSTAMLAKLLAQLWSPRVRPWQPLTRLADPSHGLSTWVITDPTAPPSRGISPRLQAHVAALAELKLFRAVPPASQSFSSVLQSRCGTTRKSA